MKKAISYLGILTGMGACFGVTASDCSVSQQQDVAQLAEQVRFYRQQYYAGQWTGMSDEKFDQLVEQLKALSHCQSPALLEVGYESVQHRVVHHAPMLSLKSTRVPDKLTRFLRRHQEHLLYIQPKIDGLAIELVYRQGMLMSAATRGNGRRGRDITQLLKASSAVPLFIDEKALVVVRGELYVPLSRYRLFSGYSSARHLTAALANRKTFNKAQASSLQFRPWQWLNAKLASDQQAMAQLANWGFQDMTRFSTPLITQQDVTAALMRYLETEELDAEVDGVVIKIDALAARDQIGENRREPRWALAYKPQGATAVTEVEAIDFAVGRTGRITPKIKLASVAIAGRQITAVSGHSPKWLEKMSVAPGARVEIGLIGQATPQLLRVVESTSQTWEPKYPVVYPGLCVTTEHHCEHRLVLQLVRLLSDGALNIQGLTDAKVRRLVQWGALGSLSALFELNQAQLLAIGLSRTKASQILEQIARARQATLHQFVHGLGIPAINENEAHLISSTFGSLEALAQAEKAQWIAMLGERQGELAYQVVQQPMMQVELMKLANIMRSASVGEEDLEALTAI